MLVYLITNKLTNKSYIGQTTQPLPKRWKQHCNLALRGSPTYLHNSIRKYGKDKFVVSSLRICENLESLNYWETWYIEHIKTKAPLGYNLNDGGDGRNPTPEVIQKISESQKGRVFSEDHKRNLSLSHTGKIMPVAVREKISAALLGKKKSEQHVLKLKQLKKSIKPFLGKKHSPETILKMRAAHLGKKMSLAARLNMSNAQKGNTNKKGKKLSECSIQKLRDARRKGVPAA